MLPWLALVALASLATPMLPHGVRTGWLIGVAAALLVEGPLLRARMRRGRSAPACWSAAPPSAP